MAETERTNNAGPSQQTSFIQPNANESMILSEAPEKIMGIDEFYPKDHKEKEITDSTISRRNVQFFGCYGISSYKRFNLHYLDDSVIIYATGNTYQIYNTETQEKKVFVSQDTDGVGSIAVHPSKKYFAIAEKGRMPNIYIYEYPSLKLYRVLRNGTENLYSHIEFSSSGNKLASVGGNPDFTITVWEWINEKVILKAKAFSQEVYKVTFSPFTDDILFTCGSGHIRFWKMAQTFTGLKLQGEIGKFGQLELSDVTGVGELPDGKVLCGTEYGTLILWDGNLVKAHLVLDQQEKTPLHKGFIEVVIFDQEKQLFITAGGDGYIKWWKFQDIDNAEAGDFLEVAIAPVKEQIVMDSTNNRPAYIVTMIRGTDHWLIGDGNGKIWKLYDDPIRVEQVMSFHSRSIQDIAIPQAVNASITIGQDGQVMMWDFVKDRQFYSRQFIGAGSCSDVMNYSDSNQGRVIAVGFDNGIVRILLIGSHDFMILKAFKAHDTKVVRVKYSPDNAMFVTASEDGEIFFFQIGTDNLQRYDPLCMVKIPSANPTSIKDLRWDSNSSHILVGCANGRVFQYQRPNPKDINNHETYLAENVPFREWCIKMMEFQMKKNQKKDPEEEEKKKRMRLRGELPKEEDEPEENWDPEPILACLYTQDGTGRFIITSQGLFSGYYYICDFNNLRPLQAVPIPKVALCSSLDYSPTGQFLVMGYENGEVQLRLSESPSRFLQIKMHDGHSGGITSIKFDKDEKYLMTTAEDGLMYIHQIDKENIRKESKFDAFAGIEGIDYMPDAMKEDIRKEKSNQFFLDNVPYFPAVDKEADAINHAYLASSVRLTEDVNQDIVDPTQYSIQQAKLRTEEDHRMKLAEEKKQGVRGRINLLRDTFKKLLTKNLDSDEWLRLSQEDFNIDPVYFDMLRERNFNKIEEAKKEVAWGIEFSTVRLNKLKEKFYDVLEFEKFTVKALKTTAYVTTFRVHKMSEFLQKSIETFKQMLESEMLMGGKDNNSGENAEEGEEAANGGNESPNKKDKAGDNKNEAAKTATSALNKTKAAAQQATIQQHKTEGEKKREERKLQRELRKKKIEKLEKKEAMNSGEDPADRKQIIHAKQTYGDFKLKLGANYTVPENQRVNFAKKRQQMVLLEGSIHKLKVDFNKKISELKVNKQEIIDRVKRLNLRLKQINTDLGDNSELFEPTIDEAVEYPEKFFEVQDKDIEAFRKIKADREKAAAAAQKKGFGSKKAAAAANPDEAAENQEGAKTEEQKAAAANAAAKNEDRKRLVAIDRKGKKIQDSDLDEEMRQIRRIELMFEKEQLQNKMNSLISAFDDEIKEMQKEKYRLESDLKNAEMKLILYFEELILLRSMEGRDHELTKRLAKCRQDKGVILREINGISSKLKDKKVEIDKIKVREDDLMTKFHELCAEGSDKYDIIRAYFEKVQKIRKGKRATAAGGTAQASEKAEGAEDEEEEPEEEEPEEEEEDEDEDNAIVGLPQEEYKIDEIDKLREERTKMYNEKQDILVFINDLEVQRKRLEKQEERISTELDETEDEIQDFQKEKMTKLNQLDVSVVLKIKQIQNLLQLNPNNPDEARALERWDLIKQEDAQRRAAQNGENGDDQDGAQPEQAQTLDGEIDWRGCYMPESLKDSVLFTRTQLLSLINRKRELDEDRVNLDQAYNDYKKDYNSKKKVIKDNLKIKNEREKEYNERQMLRFGNLVDLDNLEVSGPSALVLDLQNKFHKTEKKCIHMIEEADGDLEKTQRDLTQSIKNNTNLLNLIRQLGEEQLDLNRKLDSTNKAIFVDEDDEVKKNMMEEKEKLKKLLELQAKEIETLKTEINLYKKKGGHIYTKVTTNRRVANLNQD